MMLYAYWPAGTVEWDDIAVKQVAAAPAGKGKKDRRPSSESKVRARERCPSRIAELDPATSATSVAP